MLMRVLNIILLKIDIRKMLENFFSRFEMGFCCKWTLKMLETGHILSDQKRIPFSIPRIVLKVHDFPEKCSLQKFIHRKSMIKLQSH